MKYTDSNTTILKCTHLSLKKKNKKEPLKERRRDRKSESEYNGMKNKNLK